MRAIGRPQFLADLGRQHSLLSLDDSNPERSHRLIYFGIDVIKLIFDSRIDSLLGKVASRRMSERTWS